tara:strand:+ start:995 stop:1261 length:267 start_codon:yes stop_codon:yes gene_type:complete
MRLFLNEWKKFLTEDSEGGTVEDRAYQYLIDNGVYKPIAPGVAMVDVFTGTTSAARTALDAAIDKGVFDELDRNAIDDVIAKLDRMIG